MKMQETCNCYRWPFFFFLESSLSFKAEDISAKKDGEIVWPKVFVFLYMILESWASHDAILQAFICETEANQQS